MRGKTIILAVVFLVFAAAARAGDIFDAIRAHDVEQVKAFLTKTPEMVNSEKKGWMPLMLAVHDGFNDLVDLFLANKAEVDAKDMNGYTALHAAAITGNKEIAEVLLAHGANVGARTRDGATPLHKAASCGKRAVMEVLLSHGAEVNAREDNGDTPLDYALSRSHNEVAAVLRAHGGKAEMPVHDAAYAGDIATLNALLAGNPGLVDARNGNGRTPLHVAVFSGNKPAIVFLIAHGADVNAKDKNGITPRFTAFVLGRWEIEQLLGQYGAKEQPVRK